MEKHYGNLPSDGNSAQQLLMEQNGVGKILTTCELVEKYATQLIDGQVWAYKFQLLCYLIKNDLSYAKYLWKRLPRVLRDPSPIQQKDNQGNPLQPKANPHANEAKEFVAIWNVGQSLWKEKYSEVYSLIRKGKWHKTIIPFMKMLENKHRERMVDLVNKSYSSISVKELNECYLGFENIKDISGIVNQRTNWEYSIKDKTIIEIDHTEDNVILDPTLLRQLTKYVCFMEGQQNLPFDEQAKQHQSMNNPNQSSKN